MAASAGGYAGYRGVIGGDLNATLTSVVKDTARQVLQPLYDSYRECDDPANRSTHGLIKLDYFLASWNWRSRRPPLSPDQPEHPRVGYLAVHDAVFP